MIESSYVTPQTDDGVVERISRQGAVLEVEVRFRLSAGFRKLIDGREEHLVFAARSRLARLGIDVVPATRLQCKNGEADLVAHIAGTVGDYGIEEFLPEVILPGLKIGRLVFCPPDRRLTSEQIYHQVQQHSLQLPEAFSIDENGSFTIRPHRRIYDLVRPLTRQDVLSILAQADGKSVLNRMQVARDVENIVLAPGDGVITSCSMFLHKHYVVLDRESRTLGKHLQAIVLDPVRTRGTRVFLEFTNCSDTKIVNPCVAAQVFDASPALPEPKSWFVTSFQKGDSRDEESIATSAYQKVRTLFDRLEGRGDRLSYFHRLAAVVEDWDAALGGAEPSAVWRGPGAEVDGAIDRMAAHRDFRGSGGGGGSGSGSAFGTSILGALEDGARATLLLGLFPNLVEHLQICNAALAGKIERIVFRRASYEHGPFFSGNDHSRLADYHALGLEVFWCNDAWGHLATHVFRGLRGYFVEPHLCNRFMNSLVIAIYGSSQPLPADEVEKLGKLLFELKTMFGSNLAILTGGGPGAMQQATDIAHQLDLLVGANYIETVDQATNKTAEFYQCFQDSSRHNRQRWFEIASFQIFCMGGLGTLEEIGLTLTDMKLGIVEMSPLVFFGRHEGQVYWKKLREQFEWMVDAGRAPAWLKTHVLVTDNPDEIPSFYKRILELG